MEEKKVVEKIIRDSGLWNNGREESHSFVLSPSVFEVSASMQSELENLGRALHDCLAGMGRICTIASNQALGQSATWKMLNRALRTGVPKIFSNIQTLKPNSVPALYRVDLMEGIDGKFYIAEIEGQKVHAFGYSALASQITKTLYPNAQLLPGIPSALAECINKQKAKSVVMLLGDQEIFYVPELMILQDEMTKYGISLEVVLESDYEHNTQSQLFAYFPFMYHNQGLNKILAAQYKAGEINFLIPPKPFLGSKVLLALLRNDEHNTELEAILRAHIQQTSLDAVREFIPETYLVHRGLTLPHGQFVLKQILASGMHGVRFLEDEEFEGRLALAQKTPFQNVLQKEIATEQREFAYFSEEGVAYSNWHTRIEIFYSQRSIADILVTARRDKRVHGSRDSLQIGAILS